MDVVDPQVRSRMMSGIRGRDTLPEMQLRSGLWRLGLRFRLHVNLPGKPDLVLARWRAALFVHGCFWHAHQGCRYFKIPGTRAAFWRDKLGANRIRDAAAVASLRASGWLVIVVWECALRLDAQSSVEAAARIVRSSPGPRHYEILQKKFKTGTGRIAIVRR